jgi:putative oxidoreductase
MRANPLDRYRDLGLLLLRVGIGISYMLHGAPKLLGGPAYWQALSEAVGIHVLPVFFGFLAGTLEFFGGLLLLLGLLFRPTVVLLFIMMMAATYSHLRAGDSYSDLSHALEMGILFLALFFIGPGLFSLDERRRHKQRLAY